MIPRGEKPKPNLDCKRTLSAEESVKIAGWLKAKINQEPYFLFVMCLESGARKSEVLGMQWENIDFENWSIYLPKWNFRYYWVQALKALDLQKQKVCKERPVVTALITQHVDIL